MCRGIILEEITKKYTTVEDWQCIYKVTSQHICVATIAMEM